jgi:hypothetical protein
MKDFDIRLWDKKHKKMLYWDDGFAYMTSRRVVLLMNGGMLMPPDHEILLSTTRKDSSKKTIFEGDIIQSNDGHLFEVVWDEFMFIGKGVDNDGLFTLDVDGSCLVVGNVYERIG